MSPRMFIAVLSIPTLRVSTIISARSRAYCFNMVVHPLCGFYSFTWVFYMPEAPKPPLSHYFDTFLALVD